MTFEDGTLVQIAGRPDVYVISEGKRRPIADEDAFLAYGWDWKKILVTDARSAELQEVGVVISAPDKEEMETSPEISSASLAL